MKPSDAWYRSCRNSYSECGGERKLAKEKNRHDLGREAFIKEVWKWKEVHHQIISSQLKNWAAPVTGIGNALPWMKDYLKRCAKSLCSFIKKALFIKANILSTGARCQTALSMRKQSIRSFRKTLPLPLSLCRRFRYVTVATTRPETMLGDTAVAVNPKDQRYTDKKGKKLLLPLVNREIPIITDDYVDREFGTGAVKVTPAHDPNDYAMGQRHDLEVIVVMDETGQMTGPIPQKYIGKDRFTVRKEVVEDLTALGLVEKIEDHTHA